MGRTGRLRADGDIGAAIGHHHARPKGGEMVNTGADQTPIADGDTFELTMTVGYSF